MKKPKLFKPKTADQKKKFQRPNRDREKKQLMYRSMTWRNFRFRFIYNNPNCFTCGDRSTVADHIVAHKGDEELFCKIDNFMPLCAPCHNYITGKFDMHQKQDLHGKMKWVKTMRERHNLKNSVKIVRYDK